MNAIFHSAVRAIPCFLALQTLFATPPGDLLDYEGRDRPLAGCQVPTESFVTGNGRVLATVKTGQLVTDHHFGVSGFHWPHPESVSLIQSTRMQILVDGEWIVPYDHSDRSTILERGYLPHSMVIHNTWQDKGIRVENQYHVPPGQDILIQSYKITNTTSKKSRVSLFGIIYPQLGSPVPHKKGVAKEARYDESGTMLIEDTLGTTLFYGFNSKPSSIQAGEVCSQSDVYYDLEDKRLSGNTSVKNRVVNAALSVDFGEIPAGETRSGEIVLGAANSPGLAVKAYQQYMATPKATVEATLAYWREWLEKGAPYVELPGFGNHLREIQERSRMVLSLHFQSDGMPMCGATSREYHGHVSVRNGFYYMAALDESGYSRLTRTGVQKMFEFKIGDNRFSSADENDQLGTIIHTARKHYEQSKDLGLLKDQYPSIRKFADAIIGLIDPKYGLIYSERAIHEFVAVERGYETYVNAMAFRGLDDAAAIAGLLENTADAARYRAEAERIRNSILDHLYSQKDKTFVKRIYQDEKIALPSVSMITPALFGVLDPNDPRVTNTLEFMLSGIWERKTGGIYRYPPQLQPWDEIPYGGAWMIYTSWLAKVFAMRGENEKALEILRWIIRNIPEDSRLVPEHLSTAYTGKRGYYRIYLEPVVGETMATGGVLSSIHEVARLMEQHSKKKPESTPRGQ